MTSIKLAATKNEILGVQLSALAGYDRSGLDGSKFDVTLMDESGNDRLITFCCTDVAYDALLRITELERVIRTHKESK